MLKRKRGRLTAKEDRAYRLARDAALVTALDVIEENEGTVVTTETNGMAVINLGF